MPMYKFAWATFVTDQVVETLARVCEVDRATVEEQRPTIAQILSCVGGFPLTESTYTLGEFTTITFSLLHESLRHVISLVRHSRPLPLGFIEYTSPFPEVETLRRGVARVNLNAASVETLVPLPAVGPTIAQRIVTERLRRGPYTSLDDLDRRVKGLGRKRVQRLAGLVWIEDPIIRSLEQLTPTDNFESDFAIFVSLQVGKTSGARLESALQLIATKCAQRPHPSTKHGLVRGFDFPKVEATVDADWVSVLAGETYYQKLPQILNKAQQEIVICMFHIVYPSKDHPTHQFMAALKDAHVRGVSVRVLIDRDRASDPYRSTVINSAAKSFFDENGISCKYDSADKLLHSKFIIVDDSLAVVGSHNWSAASYFQSDDVSLVFRSKGLNNVLRGRFDKLWAL